MTESVELASTSDARTEAARRIGALLSAHADLLWTDEEWRMDVTDARGLILFSISVIATRSPATALPGRPK